MIPVYAYFPYFALAVPMREVNCVGCSPRAWDPRSQWSMLNDFLYVGHFGPWLVVG